MLDQFEHTVLVTGGAGYIGSILVRRLLQQGYRVICADILRYGGRSLLDVWDHPSFLFKHADISRKNDLGDLFASSEIFAVVHLAAIVGDPACRIEPDLAIRTNRIGSMRLLEKAMQAGIRRFIFASTCSNYGKMENPDGYVDEASTLSPISLYAELKVEFEKILLSLTNNNSFCPTVLRFATAYGLSPRMRFDLTVNEFTKELALSKKLEVYGEQFWRPYCHVSDLARAIMLVLGAPEEKVYCNVFNIGDSSQNYTKQMLITELVKIIPNAQVSYIHKDEDPRDYRVSFTKIRNQLEFTISRTVPDGMNDILKCLKTGIIENPDHSRYYNTPR